MSVLPSGMTRAQETENRKVPTDSSFLRATSSSIRWYESHATSMFEPSTIAPGSRAKTSQMESPFPPSRLATANRTSSGSVASTTPTMMSS